MRLLLAQTDVPKHGSQCCFFLEMTRTNLPRQELLKKEDLAG